MTSSNGNIVWVTAIWSPVNSPHKGQWRGALMFSLICVWINGWANNREAGDLRRHSAHYDVIVMNWIQTWSWVSPPKHENGVGILYKCIFLSLSYSYSNGLQLSSSCSHFLTELFRLGARWLKCRNIHNMNAEVCYIDGINGHKCLCEWTNTHRVFQALCFLWARCMYTLLVRINTSFHYSVDASFIFTLIAYIG